MAKDPYLYLSNKELEQLEKEKMAAKPKRSLGAELNDNEFMSHFSSTWLEIDKEVAEYKELKKTRAKLSFKIKRAFIRALVIIGILKYK